MEYKEAIERLKEHFRVHYDGAPHPKLDEAVKLAYEAMEKEIPIKPDLQEDGFNNVLYKCPKCGTQVGHYLDYDKDCYLSDYCDCCGQRLEW